MYVTLTYNPTNMTPEELDDLLKEQYTIFSYEVMDGYLEFEEQPELVDDLEMELLHVFECCDVEGWFELVD